MARKRQFCTRRFRAVLVFLGFGLPMIVWLPSVLLLLGGWIRGAWSCHDMCFGSTAVLAGVFSGIGFQRNWSPTGVFLQWD